MYAQIEKSKENKSRAVVNSVNQKKSSRKEGFGFLDNRLKTISQRKLQEMANNTPPVQRFNEDPAESNCNLQSQKSTSFQARSAEQDGEWHGVLESNNIVQRLVYLIDDDKMTAGSYRHLTEVNPENDPTGSLRPIDATRTGLPFEQLGINESLHIIVHGVGGGLTTVGNASDLLNHLMDKGLRPESHTGTIRLISCFSGTPSENGSFASQFAAELRKRGFTNPVIGFDGLVQVRDGASVFIVPQAKSREFFLRSTLKERHKERFNLLSSQKPAKEALAEEWELFQLDLETLREQFTENLNKLSALWEPQSLGKNIEYIPEAREYVHDMLRPDLYSRQIEERKFNEWYRSMLAGYHHDTEIGTSSGTPSYIS